MRLGYATDDGAGWRARLGLIVLHVDETVEAELRGLLAIPGVALHCTRIRSGMEVTAESLDDMAARLPAAAAMLPPSTGFDAVGYACTSGASVIGSERVAALIRSGRAAAGPGSFADTAITDPLSAALAAFGALGAHRIGFVSPYVEDVSTAMRAALEAAGLEVAAFGSFAQAEEYRVARIAPSSVLEGIVRVGESAPCDGVLVSCTNLRTLDVLEAAEDRLGVPVISSNQALAWHMLRRAGIDGRHRGLGSLFAR